MQNLGKNTKFR